MERIAHPAFHSLQRNPAIQPPICKVDFMPFLRKLVEAWDIGDASEAISAPKSKVAILYERRAPGVAALSQAVAYLRAIEVTRGHPVILHPCLAARRLLAASKVEAPEHLSQWAFMAALRRVPYSYIIAAMQEVGHRQVSVADDGVTDDRNVPACKQSSGFVDRESSESNFHAVLRSLRIDLDLRPNVARTHPSKTGVWPSSEMDTVLMPCPS
eukprot:7297096-Prymnesium_polylepis.1